jgi:hypothetical protein
MFPFGFAPPQPQPPKRTKSGWLIAHSTPQGRKTLEGLPKDPYLYTSQWGAYTDVSGDITHPGTYYHTPPSQAPVLVDPPAGGKKASEFSEKLSTVPKNASRIMFMCPLGKKLDQSIQAMGIPVSTPGQMLQGYNMEYTCWYWSIWNALGPKKPPSWAEESKEAEKYLGKDRGVALHQAASGQFLFGQGDLNFYYFIHPELKGKEPPSREMVHQLYSEHPVERNYDFFSSSQLSYLDGLRRRGLVSDFHTYKTFMTPDDFTHLPAGVYLLNLFGFATKEHVSPKEGHAVVLRVCRLPDQFSCMIISDLKSNSTVPMEDWLIFNLDQNLFYRFYAIKILPAQLQPENDMNLMAQSLTQVLKIIPTLPQ